MFTDVNCVFDKAAISVTCSQSQHGADSSMHLYESSDDKTAEEESCDPYFCIALVLNCDVCVVYYVSVLCKYTTLSM